jgi:hypothetical protein
MVCEKNILRGNLLEETFSLFPGMVETDMVEEDFFLFQCLPSPFAMHCIFCAQIFWAFDRVAEHRAETSLRRPDLNVPLPACHCASSVL